MSHPLAMAGPVWSSPPHQTSLPDDVPAGVDGLEALALQARWREVVQRCRSATATGTAAALCVGTYSVLALLKLNMVDEAAAELGKLGSLEDPAYLGSKAQGSPPLVPFALRVLRADLPWRLGRRQEATDRLHALLQWCSTQEAAAAAAAAAAAGEDATAPAAPGSEGHDPAAAAAAGQQQLWRRRHRGVLFLLVNRHSRLRQFVPALALLDRLLQRDAADAEAWTEAGLVQAQLGDLAAATHSLQHAEQLMMRGGGSGLPQAQRQAAVHRNRGLLLFLQHDYRGAAKEYAAAVAADPSDAAAINNHALALMYSNSLSDATAALEAAFQRAPAALLQESIVTNLASQYELQSTAASLATKRRMGDWVAAAAPDDFALASTKTGALA